MYQYYTLDECFKLRKELHIPWKYIEECVGIKRTTFGNYKTVVTDPDAIKRVSILYTVAIRSYMESGVATAEEKKLFESFESEKRRKMFPVSANFNAKVPKIVRKRSKNFGYGPCPKNKEENNV